MKNNTKEIYGRRTVLTAFGAAVVSSGLFQKALAAESIRAIVTTAPGSSIDVFARAVQPYVSKILGETLVIDNQAAAGGIVGTKMVFSAASDGKTIGIVSNSHASNALVYKNLPYDTLKDFKPVTVAGAAPLLLVVNPKKLNVRNLAELTAALKAKPGEYFYGSSGNGTGLHLAAEMYLDQARLKSTHVPYKGTAPFVADLVGGQVDWGIAGLATLRGQIANDSIRPLAVLSRKRMTELASVPTAIEQGMPELVFDGWIAVIVASALPKKEVDRLYQAFSSAASEPEVKAAVSKSGVILDIMTPEQSVVFIKSEYDKFSALAKKVNFKNDDLK